MEVFLLKLVVGEAERRVVFSAVLDWHPALGKDSLPTQENVISLH